MFILKLLGVLILLGTGTVIALISRQHEKRKLRYLEGWIELIRYIGNQINCYLMPLNEILEAIEPERTNGHAPTGEERLRAILAATQGDLDEDSRRLLERFVTQIGNGYREDQIRLCEYTVSSLSVLRDKFATELPARLRVRTALCLCVAAGGALLLW